MRTYYITTPTGKTHAFKDFHNAEMYARAKSGICYRFYKKGNKIVINDYTKQFNEAHLI